MREVLQAMHPAGPRVRHYARCPDSEAPRPPAGPGESQEAEGAGLQTNPHLLTTTPARAADPRPGPGPGQIGKLFTSKDSGTRRTTNAWKYPDLGHPDRPCRNLTDQGWGYTCPTPSTTKIGHLGSQHPQVYHPPLREEGTQ